MPTNPLKKHSKAIIITISFLLIIISIAALVYGFLDPKYFIIGRKPLPSEEYVLTETDLNSPVYTMILKKTEKGNESIPEQGIAVIRMHRTYLFFWTYSEDEDLLAYGKLENYNLGEFRKTAVENNLANVNPDPDRIKMAFQKGYKPPEDKGVPSNEYTYFNEFNYSDTSIIIPLDKYKNLKKDMTWGGVEKETGQPGRGYCKGLATKLCEENYFIDNPKVSFIALGFDADRATNPNTKLVKIVIVKKDRTFIEVPTNTDGTFDFDLALSKI